MGLFFQDEEVKRTKTTVITRIIIGLLMVILFIYAIFTEFDFLFLRLMFILGGFGWILDAVEKYLQRKEGKGFLIDLGFAMVWFILAFVLFDPRI
jgi:hypothetical protein